MMRALFELIYTKSKIRVRGQYAQNLRFITLSK